MTDHTHDTHDSAELHVHVTPFWVYCAVWIALMILTGITVFAATLHLGPLNIPLMLAIAFVKGTLVVMFFMHLLFDDRFNLLLFLGAILFIGIFFVFTMMDPMTRGVVNPEDRDKIHAEQFRPTNLHGMTAEDFLVDSQHAKSLSDHHDGGHAVEDGGDHGSAAPAEDSHATDSHGTDEAPADAHTEAPAH